MHREVFKQAHHRYEDLRCLVLKGRGLEGGKGRKISYFLAHLFVEDSLKETLKSSWLLRELFYEELRVDVKNCVQTRDDDRQTIHVVREEVH